MNWKNFLSNKIIYRSICGVVIAALLVSVAAPVVRRAHAEPENPLLSSEIEDIEILHAGEAENLSKYASSLTNETQGEGNGQTGDSGQGNRAPGEGEEEDPVAEEEKEENVEGSEDPDSGPSLEQLSQSTVGTSQQSDPSGEEGQNDGLEGEEGGEEVELDLAAVMSWYKHGSQEKTIVCQPGSTVGKEIMTAQLQNEQLQMSFLLLF